MQTTANSAHDIFRDPRLRTVTWRDLVPVSRVEVVLELLLPAVWLALSLLAASTGRYLPALLLSFIFFLTGLRIVHNAFHSALGLPRAANDAVLWVMSLIMLGSLHAVRFNHLRHHTWMMAKKTWKAAAQACRPGARCCSGLPSRTCCTLPRFVAGAGA